MSDCATRHVFDAGDASHDGRRECAMRERVDTRTRIADDDVLEQVRVRHPACLSAVVRSAFYDYARWLTSA